MPGIVVDCFQKQQVEHILEPLSDPRYGANDGPGRSQPIRNMLVVPLQVQTLAPLHACLGGAAYAGGRRRECRRCDASSEQVV
jgi:hypothetical protein